MRELDHKESWVQKNWYYCTVVLEKTLEGPLDSNEIQPVHPRGNQSWIFSGRTDAEAETPILWLPNVKNWLIWKDPDAGKDWRHEKVATENEMIGWHHWLNGHELEQALGDGERQGNLACCSPWGHKELDMTEQLNNNNTYLFSDTSSQYVLSDCYVLGTVLDSWHVFIHLILSIVLCNICYCCCYPWQSQDSNPDICVWSL